MAKDIDLNSPKWMDLIFEGKNRAYGAYVLRNESSDRHLKALFIVLIVGLAVVYLPGIISGLIPEKIEEVESENYVVQEVNMADIEKEVPEENIIREMNPVPPPPVMKATVKLTTPVIAPDEEVADEDLMATQDELTDTKASISVANVEGSLTEGTDIADLEDNKVIIQAEEIEPFDAVETDPLFPGGMEALYKWVEKNMKYPKIAAEQGIGGRVIIRFVVNQDGSVDRATIFKSVDPSIDAEAIRIISKMPKWTPGENNGRAVPVWYTLPLLFEPPR